jgi:hypothetical protein
MKKYLLIIFCSLFTLYAQAQDSIKTVQKITKQFTKEAEPERMTWEVATDVYPWIFGGGGSRNSIFVRKNVTKVKGLNEVYRAYRFKVSLSTNFTSVDTLSYLLYADRGKLLSPSLSIGYEYQEQMGKWQLFYGSDFLINYYTSEIENGYPNFNNSNNFAVRYAKNQGYKVGFSPFIGIKYFIYYRFAISLESSFLAYFSSSNISEKYTYNNGQVQRDENTKISSFGTNIFSISAFNVSYLF